MSIYISRLIREVKGSNPHRSDGENLATIELSDELREKLHNKVISMLTSGFQGDADSDKLLWGAAMLLVGAHAFSKLEEGPFTYDRIGEIIGCPDLSSWLNANERNYMEKGADLHWKIPILRRKNSREFQATMFFHSGGGEAFLPDLCQQVTKSPIWSWSSLAQSELSDIERWLDQLAKNTHIPKRLRKILVSKEGKIGMAERLRQFAIQVPDHPPTPPEPGPVPPRATNIVWVCKYDNHIPYVYIRLPDVLVDLKIPEDAERIRVTLADTDTSFAFYSRDNDSFVYLRGTRQIRLSHNARFPVTIIAEYRQGSEVSEVILSKVDFPSEPIAIFDAETMLLCEKYVQGQSVILVALPEFSIQPNELLQHVYKKDEDSLGFWRGCVPNEPTEILLDSGSEKENWLFGANKHNFRIQVEGDVVEDVRIARAIAVRSWPQFSIESTKAPVKAEILGPQGLRKVTLCSFSNGLLCIDDPRFGLGLYAVNFVSGEQRKQVRFALVPQQFECLRKTTEDGTELSIVGLGAKLSCREASISKEGVIDLDKKTRGTCRIHLDFYHKDIPQGIWRPSVSPLDVELLQEPGGELLEHHFDINALKGRGGLQIYGEPGDTVTLYVGNIRITRELRQTGYRFVPFSVIPSRSLEAGNDGVMIKVVWQSRFRAPKTIGPFIDPTTVVPNYAWRHESSEYQVLELSLSQLPKEGVELLAIPAWAPWEPPQIYRTQEVKSDTWPGLTTYAASLPPNDSPYGYFWVTLLQSDRRICGFCKVHQQSLSRRTHNADFDYPELSDILIRPASDEEKPSEENLFLRVNGLRTVLSNSFFEYRHLPHLIININTYTPKNINAIVDPMIELMTPMRLLYFLKDVLEEKEHDSPVVKLYKGYNIPWLAVKSEAFQDLDVIDLFAQSSLTKKRQMLAALSECKAGLLLPVVLSARDKLLLGCDSPESIGEVATLLRDVQTMTQNQIAPLNSDDLDFLTTSIVQYPTFKELARKNIRLRALVKAAGSLESLGKHKKLSEIIKRYAKKNIHSVWKDQDLEVIYQNDIPANLQELERAVMCLSYDISRWRFGRRNPILWRLGRWPHVRELWTRVPDLFDFWLNLFALRNITSQFTT